MTGVQTCALPICKELQPKWVFTIPSVVVHGPLYVRGSIRLVNSDNERDLILLILEGTTIVVLAVGFPIARRAMLSGILSAPLVRTGYLNSRKFQAITGLLCP